MVRPMRPPTAFLVALALSSGPLLGAPGPAFPVDSQVRTVRTGGYWETGTQRGRYRVVVASFGSEHVSSHVRFEWLTETEERIAKIEVLHEVLLGSVDVESMRWDKAGTTVVISGELRDGSKYRCQVYLRIDGSYSRGTGC
jgi:hypothetical protein